VSHELQRDRAAPQRTGVSAGSMIDIMFLMLISS